MLRETNLPSKNFLLWVVSFEKTLNSGWFTLGHAQGLILAGSGDHVVPEIEYRWAACKARALSTITVSLAPESCLL